MQGNITEVLECILKEKPSRFYNDKDTLLAFLVRNYRYSFIDILGDIGVILMLLFVLLIVIKDTGDISIIFIIGFILNNGIYISVRALAGGFYKNIFYKNGLSFQSTLKKHLDKGKLGGAYRGIKGILQFSLIMLTILILFSIKLGTYALSLGEPVYAFYSLWVFASNIAYILSVVLALILVGAFSYGWHIKQITINLGYRLYCAFAVVLLIIPFTWIIGAWLTTILTR